MSPIDFQRIKNDKSTFIIAEIGQNHQGNINIAKKLMKTAKECGADCVKFQKTCLTEKFTQQALNRPYISPNSWGTTYGEHKSYLEFSHEQYVELKSYAEELDILFTASAMDEASFDFLVNLNVPLVKIGSGDGNNLILIEKAANKRVPLVISTGMLNFVDVQEIYDRITKVHHNLAILHCVSAYPTPIESLNLNVINLYKNHFPDICVGYSGHELGIYATIAAVALGAKVIERHITLDKNQKGSDHKCSLEPEEFAMMISEIRKLEIALGVPNKVFQTCEDECFRKLGKTIVFSRNLNRNHRLVLDDFKIKVAEPKGVDGRAVYKMVGKKLLKDVQMDESLLPEYLE